MFYLLLNPGLDARTDGHYSTYLAGIYSTIPSLFNPQLPLALHPRLRAASRCAFISRREERRRSRVKWFFFFFFIFLIPRPPNRRRRTRFSSDFRPSLLPPVRSGILFIIVINSCPLGPPFRFNREPTSSRSLLPRYYCYYLAEFIVVLTSFNSPCVHNLSYNMNRYSFFPKPTHTVHNIRIYFIIFFVREADRDLLTFN